MWYKIDFFRIRTHLRRLAFHPAVLLLLAIAAVLALYAGSLRLWWCCDDPSILQHANLYSPAEYFFVPAAWRALIPYSLTPWLSLAYDLDLALFGFQPTAFFAHHLLILALCAWFLQRIAARWVGDGAACVAPLIFLVGAPVAVAAQLLMVRQYLEGLLFFLLALWLVIRVLDGEKGAFRFVAALSFAVAVTAKEVFVPLGFVPFLLPLAGFRRRVWAAWPWLLVIALYVPWRAYMLGDLLGGYVPGGGLAGSSIGELTGAFAKVPALLWSSPLAAGAGLVLVFGVALQRASVGPRMVLAWLALLPAWLLLPLLPLVRMPGLSERYFIVPWAALALLSGLAFGRAWRNQRRWLRAALLAAVTAVAGSAWLVARPALTNGAGMQAMYRAVGMAYLDHDAPVALWGDPMIPYWFFQGLEGLRPAMGRQAKPPYAMADESDLVAADSSVRRILRYDAARQAMLDVTVDWPDLQNAWRQRLVASPMTVVMDYDRARQILSWNFGPAEGGSFALVSLGGVLPLPTQGRLRMELVPKGCFRIRQEGPASTLSYSPLLAWPTAQGLPALSRTSWQGQGDMFESSSVSSCQAPIAP